MGSLKRVQVSSRNHKRLSSCLSQGQATPSASHLRTHLMQASRNTPNWQTWTFRYVLKYTSLPEFSAQSGRGSIYVPLSLQYTNPNYDIDWQVRGAHSWPRPPRAHHSVKELCVTSKKHLLNFSPPYCSLSPTPRKQTLSKISMVQATYNETTAVTSLIIINQKFWKC